MPTILIADDERNIRSTLSRFLRLEGYATIEAENGEEALAHLERGEADLLVLDLQMPGLDGLGVLEAASERGLSVPTLVLTAHGSIEKAVRAVRLGAFDFIEKPPEAERILLAAANALRHGHLEQENRRLAEEAGIGGEILGASDAIRALIDQIRRVAPTDASVLILGENGTGKELVARALHAASPRSRRPLVTVNCAAIPETLFESELFGHERGAFTGATEARRGKFRQADGGTLFLDEVGEVPLALQPKMLRAVETGEIERVGGRATERVSVRLVAATNRDLEEAVRQGRFREDLFYRLYVVPLRVPPLRERGDDSALLARHFLDAACRRNRVRPKTLTGAAVDAIVRHGWPGNVRELRHAMERIAILAPETEVGPDRIRELHGIVEAAAPAGVPGEPPFSGGARSSAASASGTRAGEGPSRPQHGGSVGDRPLELATEMQRHERKLILEALEKSGWRMAKAARLLGLERSHLYKKLKALGIDRPGEG